jgi:hypothetical protein
MSYNKIEAAELPNISYPQPVHFSSGRVGKLKKDRLRWRNHRSPVGSSSHTPHSPPSLPKRVKTFAQATRERFSSALSKAISVRVRVLARALTDIEWRSLRDAVRKQMNPIRTDTLSKQVEYLTERLTKLEQANPQGALMLQDSISMFATQVSVLREQFLQHTLDKEFVQEGCSHFQKKKIFSPPTPSSLLNCDIDIPGIGLIVWYPRQGDIHTCCPSCLEHRIDSLFYWTGFYLKTFKSFTFHELGRSPTDERLAQFHKRIPDQLHPLMVQDIWSSILAQKFKTRL